MTIKTIIICDECEKEIKKGLYNLHYWSCQAFGMITYPEIHFCSIEHLKNYLNRKASPKETIDE